MDQTTSAREVQVAFYESVVIVLQLICTAPCHFQDYLSTFLPGVVEQKYQYIDIVQFSKDKQYDVTSLWYLHYVKMT